MAESRVKKTLLNARVNLIFYFLTLALSFISRKVFLNCLGDNFVGLTGTIQNLLGFLNLAELGIGTAIGYVLYKPLFDHDETKINEIISVMGYLYRIIGIIITIGGVILSFFIPFIFPSNETGFNLLVVYAVYYSFLGSSLIGYFINYRQNLLGADQRNYVVAAYYQTINIATILIQLVVAYYTQSYYLWAAIQLFFGIIYSIILNNKINQTYPWLKSEIRLGKQLLKKYPEVITKTKQIFIHRINSFAQFQTTPIFIYTFVSLKIVAHYNNYTIIVDKICLLLNTALEGIGASIGNLIAEGNKRKILDVFYEFSTIRFFFAGIFAISVFIFIEPLISVWIGPKYILASSTLILIILKIYIQLMTGAIGPFLFGYGLFADVWASVLQTVIFLSGAVIGGYLYGLNGIIIAGAGSIFIINGIWKPYYLYSKGFNISVLRYWLYWGGMNLINVASFALSIFIVKNYLYSDIQTFFDICIYVIKAFSVISLVFITFYLIFSHSAKRLILRLFRKL
ncbi:MAG: sugar transporter [Bacteroidales bacterium]|nr:sugar transporter [Bacteroidales bacterium]